MPFPAYPVYSSDVGTKPLWATLILSVVVFGWTLAIAFFLQREIDLHLVDEARAVAEHVRTQGAQYMSKRELSLVAVQALFDSSDTVNEGEFSRFTEGIMGNMPGIRSINRMDPDLTIRWVSPLRGNEKVKDLNLVGKEGQPAAELAWRTGRITATNPFPLVEGGNGFLLFAPLEVDGKRVGLVQSVNTIERFLEILSLPELGSDVYVRLVDGAGAVMYASGPVDGLTVNVPLSIANQTWALTVSPRVTWLDYLPVFLVWPIGLSLWAGGLLFLWSDAFAAGRLSAEVKARTAELEQSLETLKTLDRMKSDFLSVVTHELRTPLTSIKGYSEFLEDGIGGEMTETQQEYVRNIQHNAAQLEMLVDDLLDLARLEAGKFTLRLQTIDVTALASQVAETFRPQAKDIGIAIEVDLPQAPVTVEADPHRVTQILNNLMSNAVKFTPAGGRVRLALTAADDAIELSVDDDGIGISNENKERIFSKFFQVESQLNRSFKGTGLGLAITRGLVEAHHGEIRVDSELGRGTRMIVTLPRRQPVEPEEAPLELA